MPILKNKNLPGEQGHSRHHEKRASFSISDSETGTGSIKISKNTEGNMEVYFGFLQVSHRYSIRLTFPTENIGHEITCETAAPGLVIKSIDEDGDTATVELEYVPPGDRVGSIIEELMIKSKDSGREVHAHAHMEILGRTQGKPSLKQGVTCMEVLPDFLSSPSEWIASPNAASTTNDAI